MTKKTKKRALLYFIFAIALCILLGKVMLKSFRNKVIQDYNTKYASSMISSGHTHILVEDNVLLYCDLKDDGALCAYDMQTKEAYILDYSLGELKRVNAGILYITADSIFQIKGNELIFLCSLPDNCLRVVELKDNWLYWLVKSGDSYQVMRANVTEENPDYYAIFHTQEDLKDVLLINEKLYLFLDTGTYCMELSTGEQKRLSDLRALDCIQNESFVVFQGYGEDSRMPYYEILADGSILKISNEGGNVAAIYSGHLIYENGGKVYIYDLSNRKLKYVTDIDSKIWNRMEVFSDGIILRDYRNNDIWCFDFLSGKLDRIIKQ